MSSKPHKPTWTITLVALPHPENVPGIIRIRSLIKIALRAFRLKVVDIKEAKEQK